MGLYIIKLIVKPLDTLYSYLTILRLIAIAKYNLKASTNLYKAKSLMLKRL